MGCTGSCTISSFRRRPRARARWWRRDTETQIASGNDKKNRRGNRLEVLQGCNAALEIGDVEFRFTIGEAAGVEGVDELLVCELAEQAADPACVFARDV